MKRWALILLGGLGLSAAAYGVASLTGGWLGEPPWWTRVTHSSYGSAIEFREGRELISGAVILAGLAMFAFAAWPRRAHLAKTEEPAP